MMSTAENGDGVKRLGIFQPKQALGVVRGMDCVRPGMVIAVAGHNTVQECFEMLTLGVGAINAPGETGELVDGYDVHGCTFIAGGVELLADAEGHGGWCRLLGCWLYGRKTRQGA